MFMNDKGQHMKEAISTILFFVMLQSSFVPAFCVLANGPQSRMQQNACTIGKKARPCCKNKCAGNSAKRSADGERRRKNAACLVCPAKILANLPEPVLDDDFSSRQFLHRELGDALCGVCELHLARWAYLSVRDPAPIALQFLPMLC
jgi:hypothetical protein